MSSLPLGPLSRPAAAASPGVFFGTCRECERGNGHEEEVGQTEDQGQP